MPYQRFWKNVPYLLLSACLGAQDNPNLDPGWNWCREELIELYACTPDHEIRKFATHLPPHSFGNPLARFKTPEMYQEDGWVLVHRDFGTPEEAPPFPFYTLYNRYRGIFRIMLYNAAHREGAYFIGEISFLDGESCPGARSGLMIFADQNPRACHLGDYERGLILSSISGMTAYDSWAVFDFPLLGFDPSLKQGDPILVFKMVSIDKRSISLSSEGNIKLYQLFEDGKVEHPSFSAAQAKDALASGYSTYKSVSGFLETEILGDEARKRNGNKSWFNAANRLASSRFGSFLPYAAALGPVLNLFVGGSEGTSAEPLNFTGQLHLDTTGALQTRRDLWYYNFLLNPGPVQGHRGRRPLREVDWGVLNFTEMPFITSEAAPYCRDNWNGCDVRVKLIREPRIVVNPECGMHLESIRLALTIKDGRNEAKGPESSPFLTVDEAMGTGFTYNKHHEAINHESILWEFRFRIQNPTRTLGSEVVIFKRTAFRDQAMEATSTLLRDAMEKNGIRSVEDLKFNPIAGCSIQ